MCRINIIEFKELWKFLIGWRKVFKYVDTNKSKTIDVKELKIAFEKENSNLTSDFLEFAFRKFDVEHSKELNFDDFIRLCCIIQSMCNQFHRKANKDGIVSVDLQGFMYMVFQGFL